MVSSTRKGPTVAIAIATALVLGVDGYLVVTSRANVVTVDRALEDFRALGTADTATTDTGGAAPESPVYLYASSGYESVDIPGGRREMPEQTPVTVQHTPAGYSAQVRPYEEHVDLFEYSQVGDALGYDRWYIERTFAGQRASQDYRCPESDPTHVQAAPVGRTAHMLCTWEDRARTEGTIRLAAYEDVVLGDGTAIASAPHLVIENTTSGEVTGSTHLEVWLHPDTGLILREIRDIQSSTTSPFGRVDYREETRFELTSLTPRT